MRTILSAHSAMSILGALLLPLAPVQAEDVGTELYNEMREMMEREADALSRSVGLPPLRGDDPPQLRLWVVPPPIFGSDFVLDGQRFVFGGDEYSACIDSGSRALMEIYREVMN